MSKTTNKVSAEVRECAIRCYWWEVEPEPLKKSVGARCPQRLHHGITRSSERPHEIPNRRIERAALEVNQSAELLERDRPTAPFRAPGCRCGQLVTAAGKNELPDCLPVGPQNPPHSGGFAGGVMTLSGGQHLG
ncbi:hypothetical protein ACVMH6_000258 [Rhizobium leguminosarum]|jgi:hypothetical protein